MYVALAEALSTVLVTGDRRLAGSSGVNVAIDLVQPGSGGHPTRRNPT